MKKILSIMLVCMMVFTGFIGFLNITADNAGAAGLADSPWPMFRGNPRHTGLSPYNTSRVDGTLKWSYTTGGWVGSPAIGGDGTIYVSSSTYSNDGEGKLYAINPDGKLKWSYTSGDKAYFTPAVGGDGTIYVAGSSSTYGDDDEGKLYAINPDGTLKWSYNTGDTLSSSPAIGMDGTIYLSSGYNLSALNPDGTLKWSYNTEDWLSSSPAIGDDGTIYVGSDRGNLYAINPDGTLKWNYSTYFDGQAFPPLSTPSLGDDGTIYICSEVLYAFNPDGTLKWTFPLAGYMLPSPAIGSDGTVYVGSDALYAINPDGTQKWAYNIYSDGEWGMVSFSSPVIGGDGTIYVGSYDGEYGNLSAINPDGTLKWIYTTEDSISNPAIGSDGTIYVGSGYNLSAIGWATEPSAPRNLWAISGHGYVNLSWNAPADDGGRSITEYRIYRRTSSGEEAYLTSVNGSTTTYTDNTGATDGHFTYYYRVSAVNIAGESAKSNEVSATPKAAILDTDHDGLPDSWEKQYFDNLEQNPGDDYDNDGYTNLQEYQKNTDPTNPDDYPGVNGGESEGKGLLAYWWLFIVISIVVIVLIGVLLVRKKPPIHKETLQPPLSYQPPQQEYQNYPNSPQRVYKKKKIKKKKIKRN